MVNEFHLIIFINLKKKENIKVGQSYIMTIVPYFNDFYGGKSRPVEIVRFVYFNDYRIIPVPIHFGQVYSTENLKGIHYFPDAADVLRVSASVQYDR